MGAIHVRNVDDAVVARLKERARAHHRSLQGEVLEILREAAFGTPAPGSGLVRRSLRLKVVRVGAEAGYGRDEIYGDDGR